VLFWCVAVVVSGYAQLAGVVPGCELVVGGRRRRAAGVAGSALRPLNTANFDNLMAAAKQTLTRRRRIEDQRLVLPLSLPVRVMV
jgi:hypothetical protein